MTIRLVESALARPLASHDLDVDRLYCGRVRRTFSADYWSAVRASLPAWAPPAAGSGPGARRAAGRVG